MHSCLIVLTLILGAAKDELPASLGEYQVMLGGERIGEEQFRVFKKNGYRIESTRTLYWPEPSRQELEYELEPSFEPKKLSVVATRGGIRTELALKRKGDNWRVEVKGQGRDKKGHELGRRAGTVVDFDSLIFNALALRRMKLGAGESRDVEAITLALPDFSGARSKQTYRRVEDEEIETPFAGKIQAQVFELISGTARHRLWVAPSGVVLKGVFERSGQEQEVRLVRLETEGGTWP
ncbi:MAG: putative glycolipid-binding domain-containing protein [Vicinamibacteria bacterium]